ncbi:MAG: citramalate synthase [Acidimicrobiia bacterium]|nr:citramalate synthase [Acidimicrobiia bacterium]MBP8181701.1 citramalate synthase [Acidimicrobiia bacterium]
MSNDHTKNGTRVVPASSDGRRVEIYDTTLRDGSQREGLSLTAEDKLRIAEQLDLLGVDYIEGGWPGASPKEDEFFARAQGELNLTTAKLVAFGSTRRANIAPEDDAVLADMLAANVDTICLVAKSWDYHVTEALKTSLDEAVAMVADSVAYLRAHGKTVFIDAEHFFDGYVRGPEFGLRVLKAAHDAGASRLVLCDTNGGMLPDQVFEVVSEVRAALPEVALAGHFHDDTGCAVANSLAAVRAGAVQIQGCMNGYGERTGNANLTTLIPNLTLKLGVPSIAPENLTSLTSIANHVAELVNVALNPQAPYVGRSAFAHKAGIHTSAISRARDAYEHVDPELVGNGTKFVASEMAGKATIRLRADQAGIEMTDDQVAAATQQLKSLEHLGYHFEVADASFDLLLRSVTGWSQPFFDVESYRVFTEHRPSDVVVSEATIKLNAGGERRIATAEGNGPVNALDGALRKAIGETYPELSKIHLTDFKVRVLNSSAATAAVTRVLLDSADETGTWTTMGVSENIIDASWQALCDSIVTGLLRAGASPNGGDSSSTF